MKRITLPPRRKDGGVINIGIFLNWNDCNNSVNRFPNALYKKFDTKEEADKNRNNWFVYDNKYMDFNINTSKKCLI